jgi:hypothetical protein
MCTNVSTKTRAVRLGDAVHTVRQIIVRVLFSSISQSLFIVASAAGTDEKWLRRSEDSSIHAPPVSDLNESDACASILKRRVLCGLLEVFGHAFRLLTADR